jgi:glycine reductase
MDKKLRIVHYINQFFGQIGGEEKADIPPRVEDGPVGPGNAFNNALSEDAEIVKTIICGDTYFNENLDKAQQEIKDVLTEVNPDLIIAGPAFNAGRYGVACGGVAEVANDELNIPVISGLYPENPGYEMYRNYAYFVETSDSAAGMRSAIPDMVSLIKSFIEKDGDLDRPAKEGYLPRNLRVNLFAEKRGSARAVDILVKKINGEEFETEYPMPNFDRVDPEDPIEDIANVKLALVTSGGIVPKGNPDHIESSSASKFGKYDLTGIDDLTEESHETAHGGYDPVSANLDPDRVLPVDVLRDLEDEGEIGELHDYFYATVGNGTSVANAKAYAHEIAEELVRDGVQAVILTST